jgi:hypothetical protein
MDTDFARLYSQLGLSPDASLDEFKHAYRRRIGQLHPDRRADQADTAPGHEEFAHLVALYGMAMRFHRRHGRLPGEASAAAVAGARERGPFGVEIDGQSDDAFAAPRASAAEARSARPWLVAAGLVALLLVAYAAAPQRQMPAVPGDSQLPFETSVALEDAPAAEHSAPRLLSLGMDMRTALDIQGRPSHQRGSTWEYGPSWLRFDDGRLVEWYSSPLYRLKVSAPSALDESAADRR